VDDLLRRPSLAGAWAATGPVLARRVIAAVLAEARQQPLAAADLETRLLAAARGATAPSLQPVINATGVLLHTNLGRAPLSALAAARLADAAANYTNLEFDLETGERSRRDRHLAPLLAALSQAEASIVVNNNAAAVLLALTELAVDRQGEVLVSRGELIEIGESFRIPDIVARGGARLVEVGSTNRTRLGDYAQAITPATRMILRVHRSNFTMSGFVEQPPLAALAALAHAHRLPLVEDLGSGCLVAFPGLADEPVVAESIAAGVDLVTYSGDKLLGGPQAGILSGRAPLIARLRANPLYRALRVDALTLAALEATLDALRRLAWHELPLAAMASADDLEARTRAFALRLPPEMHAEVVPGESVFGGGATPARTLPTWLIRLPQRFAQILRHGQPAVVARVEHGHCCLDLRTVFPAQDDALLTAVRQAFYLPVR